MTEITLTQLEQSFRHAEKTIDREVAKVVKSTALKVKQTQRDTVPVKSGKTRDSTSATGPQGKDFTPTTVEAEIGPTWWVGRLIVTGNSYVGPRDYVSPSYEPHAAAHEKGISDAMTTGALKGLA